MNSLDINIKNKWNVNWETFWFILSDKVDNRKQNVNQLKCNM